MPGYSAKGASAICTEMVLFDYSEIVNVCLGQMSDDEVYIFEQKLH